MTEKEPNADDLTLEKKQSEENPIPLDRFYLCHIVFFLLGVAHFVTISFFAAANNVWMYKFRNIADLTNSAENRTELQSHFASSSTIATMVPSVICGTWVVLYGHKVKLMTKITATLAIQAVLFALLTILVKLNTDSYQTPLFGIILSINVVLSGANAINMISSQGLYPRFPHDYMKTCLIGEGTSGILGDLLQIVSVALFDDISNSALLYFAFGTFLMTLTLVLTIVVSRRKYFQHCLDTMPENTKKKKANRTELKAVLRKIWPSGAMCFLFFLGLAACHTSITSLVVSEDKNTVWSVKYFVPVVTFLASDFWLLVGRFFASHVPFTIPTTIFLIGCVIRTFIFVPAIWLCNAQPRSHLPVIFNHDWEYAIILGLFSFTNGYIISKAVLDVFRKTVKEESVLAFNLFSLLMGISQGITAAIGMVSVNII